MNGNDFEYLSKIKYPSDLKNLSDKELEKLCAEIRERLVETVSKNGGHLSPNLGTVELTVMLHYCFNTPKDSIVWDVGHQSYTHKMLTGRLNEIDTIRCKGGLSGFPKRLESKYDDFNAGHSSTSISAAYGIARAKVLQGDPSYTIAVIGDGSLTGGLAYEGLNNAGRFNKNFIVILNDNKMSISKNVGAMARYLGSVRVKPWYIRFKRKVEKILMHIPLIGKPIRRFLRGSKSRIKNMIYKNTLFDFLGYTYLGPIDGHDIEELKNALTAAKAINSPVLIHIVTKKGKGYEPAENNPKEFHGVGKFDIDTGEVISAKKGFSAFFGECICDLAQRDKKIVAITAAMTLGTGLSAFSKEYKERFFDVGIAEEHAVTFACGLASKGMIPVFAVYSTFLQRSYDQILHDAAMQKLHIVLAIDRAGIVGDDGETHQGIFDVPMLNSIPETTIFSPCYFNELERSLFASVYMCDGVTAVRYPRGGELYMPDDYKDSSINFTVYGNTESKNLIITYGRLFSYACLAKEKLKEQGIDICILKLCRIKPVDKRAVKISAGFENVFFFEEGIKSGGIAETFENLLIEENFSGSYHIQAVDEIYVQHQSVSEALSELKLDDNGMVEIINKNINNSSKEK
ncbi:MAG: 1-deoxy-D-xylulose-5-phosphate synthase [Ruminococcus sp.]|nr:1-deoxy-D-xylulose-5-phosphate synthase [Ruminococcus sp.]